MERATMVQISETLYVDLDKVACVRLAGEVDGIHKAMDHGEIIIGGVYGALTDAEIAKVVEKLREYGMVGG
jgi:hypothetical protein